MSVGSTWKTSLLERMGVMSDCLPRSQRLSPHSALGRGGLVNSARSGLFDGLIQRCLTCRGGIAMRLRVM